jgi:polysaccharide export outer membrane protein
VEGDDMKTQLIAILAVLLLPALLLAEEGDYVIGDGDGLSISVWGEGNLSQSATVRPDGKITMPALGDIVATGHTPEELSKKLEQELTRFVKVPIVTVTVTGMNNSKVFVFGGGPGTGVHNMPGRTTLLKFLTGLGNLEAGDIRNAYILRDGEIVRRDFYDLFFRGNLEEDMEIKSDDMIFFPDNRDNKIYMLGAVGNPTHIVYREDISVLDAILSVGGFTEFAKRNKVVILRKEADGVKKIEADVEDVMKNGNLDANVVLKRGDFVVVKETIF